MCNSVNSEQPKCVFFFFLSQHLLLLKHDFRQDHITGIMNSKPSNYKKDCESGISLSLSDIMVIAYAMLKCIYSLIFFLYCVVYRLFLVVKMLQIPIPMTSVVLNVMLLHSPTCLNIFSYQMCVSFVKCVE